MVRVSCTLATLALVISFAELSAQQVIYSGEVIYNQAVPSYPIAQPVESYSTYSTYPVYSTYSTYSSGIPHEVAPYPIAQPIEYSAPQTVYSDNRIVHSQPVQVNHSAASNSLSTTPASTTTSAASSKSVESTTVESTTVETDPQSKLSNSSSLPAYRKSTNVQAQPAAITYSRPMAQATPVYSQPSVPASSWQPSAPAVHAPNFFGAQDCFRGR